MSQGGTRATNIAELGEILAAMQAQRGEAEALPACRECVGVGPGEPCSTEVRLAVTSHPGDLVSALAGEGTWRRARLLRRGNHVSRKPPPDPAESCIQR